MGRLATDSDKASLCAVSGPQEPRLSCHHSEKYEIATTGEPVSQLPYPSRLGFLHSAASGVSIRYVDLNKKLCRACCDAIVPDGKYYTWSVLAGTAAADVSAVLAKLTSSDFFYPPILQAGSEAEAFVHSIPDVLGAKEVWRWLEAQGKPFYIDQLHLPVGRGITPLARKRVAKDSAVALRYGQVVTLDLIQEHSKRKPAKAVGSGVQSEQRIKTKTASEKRTSKKTSAKASRKDSTATGVSEIDLLPTEPPSNDSGPKSTIEKLESTTHESKIVKPLIGKSSTKRSKSHDLETGTMPVQEDTSKSADKTYKSSTAVNLTVAAMAESQKLASTPSIQMTTSVATKTFTRSWGWSEPFEFTTMPRKVPALSDYERVAEARVPKTPETNSLAQFIQKRLELKPAPKLRGPGDIDEAAQAALGNISSTKLKDVSSSASKKPKASSLTTNDKELSAKKSSKTLEASNKSTNLSSDKAMSSSSKDTKLATAHDKSSKDSKDNSSKQLQSASSSSGVTHLADRKVKTEQISKHGTKSETKTSEVHSRSIKTKETSQGPGSFGGVLRAVANYAEHKISDAATKPTSGKKDKRRKSSESKPRPHIKPDHHDSEQSGPQSPAHTDEKPPKPPQTEQPSSQPSAQTDPPTNGQPASQVEAPAQPDSTAITDTPGSTGPPEQNSTSVQGNTSNLADEPPHAVPQPSAGAVNFPNGISNTPTDSPNSPPPAAGEPSIQAGIAQQDDANGDQLLGSKPTWAGGYSSEPVPQPIQSVQTAGGGQGPTDLPYGSNPLPNDTGISTSVEGAVRIDFNASTAEGLPTRPMQEEFQYPQPPSSSSNAETGRHPSQSGETTSYDGKDHTSVGTKPTTDGQSPISGAASSFNTAQDPNKAVADELGTAKHASVTKSSGSGVAKDSGKGEASSYYNPKLASTSSPAAGADEPDHTQTPDTDQMRGKKLGGQAARHKHSQGKHKVKSHDGKKTPTKPSHAGRGGHNGRASGTKAGLAGLAVGAAVGYAAAEILKDGSSDSNSDSDSDSNSESDNDGDPSQDGISDDNDSESEDGVASEGGGDVYSENGSTYGEGELNSDSDAEGDHDENTIVSGTDSDSDAEDNDGDNPTEDGLSDGDSSDADQDEDHDVDTSTADEISEGDLSDVEQDDDHDDAESEVPSDEEDGSDDEPTEQDSPGPEDSDSPGPEDSDSPGPEDSDSSGNEESSVEDSDNASEGGPSDIEESDQSDQEVSDQGDFDSDF